MCSELFKSTRFLAFKSEVKKIKLFQSSFFIYNLVRNTFIVLCFGVKFFKYGILVINNNPLEDFPYKFLF